MLVWACTVSGACYARGINKERGKTVSLNSVKATALQVGMGISDPRRFVTRTVQHVRHNDVFSIVAVTYTNGESQSFGKDDTLSVWL